MSRDDELAALKQEVAALKEALSGKEDKAEPKSTFVPKTDAEWIDEMHQMRERQANSWMPPNAVQEMAQHPCNQVMRGVINDRHAPTSPSMAGTTGAVTGVHRHDGGAPSSTPGWVAPTPLSNPPGVAQADRLMDHQDKLDRIELARRIGAHEAAMRAAEKGKG